MKFLALLICTGMMPVSRPKGPLDEVSSQFETLNHLLLEQPGDREALKQVQPGIEQVLQEWKSPVFVQQIRARDPKGSLLFLQACLELDLPPELLEKWVKFMPESVGVEYELLTAETREEELLPRLLQRAGDQHMLMQILMRPMYQSLVPDRVWQEMVDALFVSNLSGIGAIHLFKRYDKFPAPFLQEAERLISATIRRPRVGNDLQLAGAYLLSHRLPAEAGDHLRNLCMRLAKEVALRGDWLPVLKESVLDPEGAFLLAAASSSLKSSDRDNEDFDYLSEITDQMDKRMLLGKIISHADNLALLRFYAQKYPEWIEHIGEALIGDLEREFSLRKIQRVEWCLREHPDYQAPIGRLDALWLDLLKTNPRGVSLMFMGANDIGISPKVIWTALLEKNEAFQDENDPYWYDVHNNLLYILEHGNADLVDEVRDAIAARREDTAPKFLKQNTVIEKVMEQFPDIVGDPFVTQLELYASHLRQRGEAGLATDFFSGKVLKTPVAEFFTLYGDDVLKMLKAGENMELVYPVLCKLVVDDGLRKTHAPMFRSAVRKAFELKGLTDPQRFCIAFAGMLLGMEDSGLDQAFIHYITSSEISEYAAWRFYFLLDKSHHRLLPGLLAALDGEGNPYVIYSTALMIDPLYPELNKQVEQVLFEGENRELACQLTDRLRLYNLVPPLKAYPAGRLDWLADVKTEDEYESFRTFLYAYGPQDHEQLLPLILPRLKTYASFSPFQGLGILFGESEANQRAAVIPLLEMLDALDDDQINFACDALSEYQNFTESELLQVGRALRRFQDKLNRNPRLLSAISRMGQRASVLEEEVARLTREGKDRNVDNAYSCLANISVDPDKRRENLSKLMQMYEGTFVRSSIESTSYVRSIGSVRDQKDRVVPFLKTVVSDFLAQLQERRVDDDTASAALRGLAMQGADEELFRFYQGLLKQAAADPNAAKLIETTLWCLNTHFEDRLPEVREEFENLPYRRRSTFAYRIIREKLSREGITLEMMP